MTLNSSTVIGLNNDCVEGVHFITVGLLSEDFSGEAQVMEPDEITQWQWFGLEELPQPLFFASEKIINNYREKKFHI